MRLARDQDPPPHLYGRDQPKSIDATKIRIDKGLGVLTMLAMMLSVLEKSKTYLQESKRA